MAKSTTQKLEGEITFKEDSEGDWRWQKRSQQNEILAISHEGYRNKADCEANARRFGLDGSWEGEQDDWELLMNYGGPNNSPQFWWRRTAPNHEIVGKSHKGFSQANLAEMNARRNGFTGGSLK
ncbi:MAG: hypothetical protein ACQEVA_06065 [Myxococcota bacterium]